MDKLLKYNTSEDGAVGSLPSRSLEPWWRGACIYQIYPRSFCDSNDDGIGDLKGITSKLDYVADLGIDAIWLSPFFKSPMADYGYDVSDFCNVDSIFGTLEDFDNLIEKAHELGLKVIIDQVYSHSSDQHPWFEESRSSRDNPKSNWYVWADAKPDGSPPNNWQSVFAGSAWQWDARRGQYYLHNFLPEQPDLNFHNPNVQDAILSVPKFWLDRGVDGFRLDALNFSFHNQDFTDNPPTTRFKRPPTRPHDFQAHIYNMSQPEIYPFLEKIRSVLDEYAGTFSVAEIGGPFPLDEMKAYTRGDDRLNTAYAFDFLYADKLEPKFFRDTLSEWPGGDFDGWPSWAFSNHDAPRAISRWRGDCAVDDYAKLLSLLLITLRGNIFIWQGEELGLEQADIAFEDLKDPEAIANWPHTLGRDGTRTPMPWHNNNNFAGFSTTKPWLPIGHGHVRKSVANQMQDSGSVLNFYKNAIRVRKSFPALQFGELEFESNTGDLLVIRRTYKGHAITAVVNLTDKNLPIRNGSVGGLNLVLSTPNFTPGANVPAHSAALYAS